MSETEEIESYLSAEEVNIIEEQIDEEWNKNPTPVVFQYKSHNIVSRNIHGGSTDINIFNEEFGLMFK